MKTTSIVVGVVVSAAVMGSGRGALAIPELIAPGERFDIAFSSGYVYSSQLSGEFCSPTGALRRVAGGGGPVTNLWSDCSFTPAELVSDGLYVYFLRWDNDTVARIWEGGGVGGITTLAPGSGLIYHRGLAMDDTHVYWADELGLRRVPKDGGEASTIVPGVNASAGLAVDDAYIYWAEGSPGTGIIKRAPKSGGAVEVLRNTGLDGPRNLAVDASHLYWQETGARLRRMPKAGGAVTNYVAADPAYQPTGLAVDSAFIYWTDTTGSSDGRLRRLPKAGGTPVNLALGLLGPRSVRLSSTHVYWADYFGIKRVLKDAAAAVDDLSWLAMEVTQGIQDVANDVPLVQEKTTFVRAWPTADIADTPGVTAVLHGTRGGVALPGSPLASTTPSVYVLHDATVNRTSLSSTFNFWLPPAWREGTITLRAQINPVGTIPESSFTNNSISVTRAFTPKAPACLVMVPVRTGGSTYTPSSAGFWSIIDRFQSLWPVPDVRVYSQDSDVAELQVCWAGPFPYPCFGDYEIPEDNWKIIASLIARDILTDDPDECDALDAVTHYVGMVSPDTSTGSNIGYANFVFPVSWVKMETDPALTGGVAFSTPRGGTTMAQELAHNYNGVFGSRWQHVNCGGPSGINPAYPYPTDQIGNVGVLNYYGFDPISLSVIPPDGAMDFMSYCGPAWVSDYNWRGIFTELATLPAGGGAVPEMLVLFGGIDPAAGNAEIQLSFRLPAGLMSTKGLAKVQRLMKRFTGAGASHALELVSAAGAVLGSLAFEPFGEFEEDPTQPFFLAMPFHPDTASVRIREKTRELGSRKVSAHTPKVHVLSPNGGESFVDSLTVQWEASDQDPDDRLLYCVQYSPNLGQTWQTLAADYPETKMVLKSADNLPGSKSALVRVIATDGLNTAVDSSDAPFSLRPHAPVAHITSPEDGAVFAPGEQVVLSGRGRDAEDGTLEGKSLRWTVQAFGAAGIGAEAAVPGLPPGSYKVVLEAFDSDGSKGAAQVTIRVAVQGRGVSFRRGDVDASGALDLGDVVRLLGFLFLGGAKPECLAAADFDGNGSADIGDAVGNLAFQFLGGKPPAPPGPYTCGPDPSSSDLGCDKACP